MLVFWCNTIHQSFAVNLSSLELTFTAVPQLTNSLLYFIYPSTAQQHVWQLTYYSIFEDKEVAPKPHKRLKIGFHPLLAHLLFLNATIVAYMLKNTEVPLQNIIKLHNMMFKIVIRVTTCKTCSHFEVKPPRWW